jgi:hypothetical protein
MDGRAGKRPHQERRDTAGTTEPVTPTLNAFDATDGLPSGRPGLQLRSRKPIKTIVDTDEGMADAIVRPRRQISLNAASSTR